jgi:hypothetical protein
VIVGVDEATWPGDTLGGICERKLVRPIGGQVSGPSAPPRRRSACRNLCRLTQDRARRPDGLGERSQARFAVFDSSGPSTTGTDPLRARLCVTWPFREEEPFGDVRFGNRPPRYRVDACARPTTWLGSRATSAWQSPRSIPEIESVTERGDRQDERFAPHGSDAAHLAPEPDSRDE